MANSNVEKLKKIIKRAEKRNINIQRLPVVQNQSTSNVSLWKLGVLISFSIGLSLFLSNKLWINDGDCLIHLPDSLSHAFRPNEDCGFCRNITQADRIAGIIPSEFEEKYAYNARPVVVTDATVNWTALDVFDFWYFKDVYDSSRLYSDQMNCQFFPVIFDQTLYVHMYVLAFFTFL